jgi:hypothetical protein
MLYTFTLSFLTELIRCRDVPWHVWKLGEQRNRTIVNFLTGDNKIAAIAK